MPETIVCQRDRGFFFHFWLWGEYNGWRSFLQIIEFLDFKENLDLSHAHFCVLAEEGILRLTENPGIQLKNVLGSVKDVCSGLPLEAISDARLQRYGKVSDTIFLLLVLVGWNISCCGCKEEDEISIQLHFYYLVLFVLCKKGEWSNLKPIYIYIYINMPVI